MISGEAFTNRFDDGNATGDAGFKEELTAMFANGFKNFGAVSAE